MHGIAMFSVSEIIYKVNLLYLFILIYLFIIFC